MAWNNELSFTGNLTSDPDFHKESGNRKDRASFRVAINEGRDDNEVTFFMSVTCWGKLADNVSKTLSKGDRVTVRGSLSQYDRTVYDEDGNEQNATVTTIIANAVAVDLAFATADITRNPKAGSSNRGRNSRNDESGDAGDDAGDAGDESGDDRDDSRGRSRQGRQDSGRSGSRSSGGRGRSGGRSRQNDGDDDDF